MIDRLFREISEWTDRTTFDSFMDYMNSRVIGQKNLKKVCANIYAYLNAVKRDVVVHNNTILTATSGMGKTETYRALRDYFKDEIPSLPVFLIDTTQLTPTGFKGSNLEDLFAPLFSLTEGMFNTPPALCFLDEFDKRIMPTGDYFDKSIQNNLLSILEGSNIVETTKRGSNRSINTENIMFFGLGSFNEFREQKKNTKTFGFIDENTYNEFEYITADSLIEAGAITELVGRFPFIINYDILSNKDLDRIINKLVYEQAEAFDCDISITKDYRNALKSLTDLKYGCRLYANKIKEDVLNVYTNALEDKSEEKDVLEIILSKQNTYKWRAYNDEEIKILKNIEDALKSTLP